MPPVRHEDVRASRDVTRVSRVTFVVSRQPRKGDKPSVRLNDVTCVKCVRSVTP